MRLLVTGGGGFIGRHLVPGLRARGWEVEAPSSRELDLLDAGAVRRRLEAGRFDVVVHAATWNATRTSMRDVSRALDANLRMYFNLVRCAGAFGRLLYYGSGAEFDREHWEPRMREDDFGRHVPGDDYGLSKYLMTLHALRTDDVWNLRLFGVYGPHEDWRIRFISNACCRALLGLPITIRQDRRFEYVHVEDVVAITASCAADSAVPHVVNVCSGDSERLGRIAELVRDASGHPSVSIEVAIDGLGPEYSGDGGLLRAALPGVRFRSLEQGVRDLLEWYRPRLAEIDRTALVADDGERPVR